MSPLDEAYEAALLWAESELVASAVQLCAEAAPGPESGTERPIRPSCARRRFTR